MGALNWPDEMACTANRDEPRFVHAGSNVCLDFHGDPSRARLVVFSDGNHHMALRETLHAFIEKFPAVEDIFYTTTPPNVALKLLRAGCLNIGNLRLSVAPHVFISPPSVLDQLVAEGRMLGNWPFMRSRGIVLLVRKENPKNITSLADLLRKDVKLFLSNPLTEKVSYQIYTDCLHRLAMHDGTLLDFLAHPPGLPDPEKLMVGEAIHHREAPQAIVDGCADVAIVFYHLALRYQRIFPELFDYSWPSGSLAQQNCDASYINCGLIGDGGEWGRPLIEFLMSDEVTEIYSAHGLERAG